MCSYHSWGPPSSLQSRERASGGYRGLVRVIPGGKNAPGIVFLCSHGYVSWWRLLMDGSPLNFSHSILHCLLSPLSVSHSFLLPLPCSPALPLPCFPSLPLTCSPHPAPPMFPLPASLFKMGIVTVAQRCVIIGTIA